MSVLQEFGQSCLVLLRQFTNLLLLVGKESRFDVECVELDTVLSVDWSQFFKILNQVFAQIPTASIPNYTFIFSLSIGAAPKKG